MYLSRGWPAVAVASVVLSTLGAVASIGLSTAAAHPFGPPLSARLNVDDDQLTVQWTAAEDDWVILGEHVGAFTTTGSGDADGRNTTGAERLRQSVELREYLLDHIEIAQGDTACHGAVEIADDVLSDGAQLTFSCPNPVSDVEVTMTPLTDINENYRTAALSETASDPERAMFTTTDPVQSWHFSPASGGTSASLWLMGGTIALVLGLGLMSAFAIIRRGARHSGGASAAAPSFHVPARERHQGSSMSPEQQ